MELERHAIHRSAEPELSFWVATPKNGLLKRVAYALAQTIGPLPLKCGRWKKPFLAVVLRAFVVHLQLRHANAN